MLFWSTQSYTQPTPLSVCISVFSLFHFLAISFSFCIRHSLLWCRFSLVILYFFKVSFSVLFKYKFYFILVFVHPPTMFLKTCICILYYVIPYHVRCDVAEKLLLLWMLNCLTTVFDIDSMFLYCGFWAHTFQLSIVAKWWW